VSLLKADVYYVVKMAREKYNLYECPRCNYTTHDKTNMSKHLHNRQKTCPPQSSHITLTEDIKEYILLNRVYYPVLPAVATSTLSTTPHTKGHIYLIREREFYHRDVPVYKVGMTKSSNVFDRLSDYKKGYEFILSQMVPRARVVEIEKNIKTEFKKIFKQHPDGFEYFIGDPYYMQSIISIVCQDFPPEIANKKLSDIIKEKNMLADRERYDDAAFARNKFGEESFDFLTEQDDPRQYIIKVLERQEGGLAKYIIDKHFNQKYSQNNNIRIDKKCTSVYDGEWILRTRDQCITMIIDNVKKDIDRFVQEYGIYDNHLFTEFTRTIGHLIGLNLDDTFVCTLDDKTRCKQTNDVYDLIHYSMLTSHP
jgi:hypothetical protein